MAQTTASAMLSIYRGSTDCTNGGISATANDLFLVGTCKRNIENSYKPLPAHLKFVSSTTQRLAGLGSAVLLEVFESNMRDTPYLALVPAEWDEEGGVWVRARGGFMAGGNYASGDTRFTELCSELVGHHMPYPVPVHDRLERR